MTSFRRSVIAAAALALVSTGALAATTSSHASLSNKEFLQNAIKGDNAEIALGRLAEARGNSQGVRNFGKILEDDHVKAKQGAIKLATKEGVVAPPGMTKQADSEFQKLQGLHGKAFDKEFVEFNVTAHKQAINMYQKEANKNGPVATYAKNTIPVLKKHLNIAESLQGSTSMQASNGKHQS